LDVEHVADENIKGITIGAVVVPQGMAYASLANLAPQFGLYSSFMGVLIYWFFATSKDITIGVRAPVYPIFADADCVNSL
jgi:solute carrier family 26 (sodium-independent sulfate anion transporter), member 11